MPRYLIDTSSLFKLLSSDSLNGENLLENSCITDPTLFEIGNVMCKRKDSSIKEMSVEKVKTLSKVIGNILRGISCFSITSTEIPNILKIALKTGTTFYDASYIYMCGREKVKLISEDVDLRRKAEGEKVTVLELKDVLADK
jgi:predicted nucleic acid-binding protein